MTALLTLAEAADELRLSSDSVRRLVAAGKLQVVYPVARRPRIARTALMAYIDRITPHVLRHTCASWQVQAGVPLYTVQRWMGHSAIKMTERYAHLAPEHLREGAAALAGSQRSYEDAGH